MNQFDVYLGINFTYTAVCTIVVIEKRRENTFA
jgi:hypothetical protein